MQRFWLVGVLGLVAGCDINLNDIMDQFDGAGSALDEGASGSLSERSRVVGSSDGIHVGEGEGGLAVVGLSGMTCQVETSSGWMYTDVDTTMGNETVEDGVPSPDGSGDIVLVTSPETDEVVVVDSDDGTQSHRFVVGGLAAARFVDEQVVTVSDEGGGCVVQWWTETTLTDTTEIGGGVCQDDADIAVDDGGRVWVGLGDSLAVVTTSGARTFDVPTDLVAFDAAANVIYTAMAGEDVVTAVETDGRVRWTATLGGTVVGLDDMGPVGQAAVSVEDTFAHSVITFLDGSTGSVVEEVGVNRPAGEVVVADSGDAMGLGQEGGVDFFGVSLE